MSFGPGRCPGSGRGGSPLRRVTCSVFDRFAAQRIRGAILDAVRAADWAPRSVRTLARRLESVEQRLATELGRVPSSVEMAERPGHDPIGMALLRLQDRLFRSVVLALEHEVNDAGDEDLTLVDVLRDRSSVEPLEELETRELHAYLRDAVHLLPERHRLVIVGYFLENRTSQELARFLGVTESRVSQLRSEALTMLKDGIEAQYAGPVACPGPEHRAGRPAQGHLRSGHLGGQRVAEPSLSRDGANRLPTILWSAVSLRASPAPGCHRRSAFTSFRRPGGSASPDDPGGFRRLKTVIGTAPTPVGAVPRPVGRSAIRGLAKSSKSVIL